MLDRLVRKSLVAVLSLTSIGCRLIPGDKDESLVNTSQSNPAPAIIDEVHRFRLDWPGLGWQLLNDSSDKTVLSDSTVCAYDTEQGLSGSISVGHAPQATLPAYVDDWLQRLAYLDKRIITRKDTLFRNSPTESFDVTGIYLGQPAQLRGVIFFHQNYVYRLLVSGYKEKFDSTRAQRFFDSFTLLPGKVQEPSLASATGVTSGIGWRVKNGQYQSAITGLSVTAPPGWHLLVANELHEFSPDADVALVHDDPDASLAIRIERVQSQRTAGSLSVHQQAHRQNLRVDLVNDSLSLSLLGSKRKFQMGRAEFGNRFAYGTIVRGGRQIELIAGYSELFQGIAPQLLEQVTSKVELLAESDQRALQNQLLADQSAEHWVARDVSLRNGCFHHFSKCFSWCRPPGFWEMAVGSSAQKNDDELSMVAKSVQLGLLVQLYSQPIQYGGLRLFQHLSSERSLLVGSSRGRTLSGHPMQFASGTVHSNQESHFANLYVVEHKGNEIAMLVSCGTENPGCRLEMDSVVDSFRLEECVNAAEISGNNYIDRRLGFSQKLPDVFKLASRSEAFGEAGQRLLWVASDASLTLVALVPSELLRSLADFLAAVDQATRANVPPALLHQGHTSTMLVKGELARRTSYIGLNYRFDTLILKHKQLLLAWLFSGRNADRLGELVAGFEWVD